MKLEKLAPAFQDYLWGGTKLRDVYGKRCDFDKVAESWELSTHPAGESTLAGGERDGLPLGQYFQQFPQALGKNAAAFENFPVLIKLIDAKEPLSIQVHPSDEYALRVEGEYGKTEMWVIVDCDPGAFLYFGVNRPVSKEEFRQRIENNTVLEVLNKVEVHPGDVFFIQSGTIHAIGAGILICEIQQNSNCTYRVYDYDRRGADGKPRELHTEQAKGAIDYAVLPDYRTHYTPCRDTRVELVACPYFTTSLYDLTREQTLDLSARDSFVVVMCLEGRGTLTDERGESVPVHQGETVLVPAAAQSLRMTPDGRVKLLRSWID